MPWYGQNLHVFFPEVGRVHSIASEPDWCRPHHPLPVVAHHNYVTYCPLDLYFTTADLYFKNTLEEVFVTVSFIINQAKNKRKQDREAR